MKIISQKEFSEAYEISKKTIGRLKQLAEQKEIDPKIKYPIYYTQENLKRTYSNLTNNQDEINEIIFNIYKGFRLYAKNLDFVTDNLIQPDKSFYVINEKIVEMFIDRAVKMSEVPIGEIGNQGIFFRRDEIGARRLCNELEKWVAEQRIGKF